MPYMNTEKTKKKRAWNQISSSQDECHEEDTITVTTYFLYKGALPAMSDKNIITLQTKWRKFLLNKDESEKTQQFRLAKFYIKAKWKYLTDKRMWHNYHSVIYITNE